MNADSSVAIVNYSRCNCWQRCICVRKKQKNKLRFPRKLSESQRSIQSHVHFSMASNRIINRIRCQDKEKTLFVWLSLFSQTNFCCRLFAINQLKRLNFKRVKRIGKRKKKMIDVKNLLIATEKPIIKWRFDHKSDSWIEDSIKMSSNKQILDNLYFFLVVLICK